MSYEIYPNFLSIGVGGGFLRIDYSESEVTICFKLIKVIIPSDMWREFISEYQKEVDKKGDNYDIYDLNIKYSYMFKEQFMEYL